MMTEYFISYYVQGCPYVGDGTYDDGILLLDSPDAPSYTPKNCGKSACFFCASFKKNPKEQCPVKKRKKKNLYSRCRIGDLSEEEFKHFKKESGIKSNRFIGFGYELVMQSIDQIPLASLKDRWEHDNLLEQFDRDAKCDAPYIFEYGNGWEYVCYSLYDCIEIADKIRKMRRHGSVSTSPIAPQPADVANSEPTPEPEVEPDTEAPADEEDIADKVDRLIAEGKGRWVEQYVFLDEMYKNADHHWYPTKDIVEKKLYRNREAKYIKLSKKNSRIGTDKAGYIFERSGDGKHKQNYRYIYFLEYDNKPSPNRMKIRPSS